MKHHYQAVGVRTFVEEAVWRVLRRGGKGNEERVKHPKTNVQERSLPKLSKSYSDSVR